VPDVCISLHSIICAKYTQTLRNGPTCAVFSYMNPGTQAASKGDFG
jgi:hypothetical protein